MADNHLIFRQGIDTSATSDADAFVTNSYWLGGVDTRNKSLQNLDLARTGYGRLFITKMPRFVEATLENETKMFKHLLEFANIGIDGLAGYSVETGTLTAGYAGTTVETPTGVKDDTNSVTIKINETNKVLIQSYLDYWVTGTIDPFTGYATYHGIAGKDTTKGQLPYRQANHTMEAVYVHTDPTGQYVNYACLLTNMFPKGSDHSHWVTEPGSHELVSLSIEFTCNKYVTNQITAFGKALLDNFTTLKNYLNFNTGYSIDTKNNQITGYDSKSGALMSKTKSTNGTDGITAWYDENGKLDLTGARPVEWTTSGNGIKASTLQD